MRYKKIIFLYLLALSCTATKQKTTVAINTVPAQVPLKEEVKAIDAIVILDSGKLTTISKYDSSDNFYHQQSQLFANKIAQYPLIDTTHNDISFVGTTNFSLRKPNYVIIHYTAQDNCDQTLRTFTLPRTQVSSHYVICREGKIFHMLNDYLRGHHAGISKWGNTTDLNSSSIGIELDNDGAEPFAEVQISCLLTLLDTLKRVYNIPTANFLGHADIAPTRKGDPGHLFPWKLLSDKGFGYWWNDTTGMHLPDGFDYLSTLRLVGYDIRDTTKAKIAFKRHFMQDTTANFTNSESKVLYALYKKYL